MHKKTLDAEKILSDRNLSFHSIQDAPNILEMMTKFASEDNKKEVTA